MVVGRHNMGTVRTLPVFVRIRALDSELSKILLDAQFRHLSPTFPKRLENGIPGQAHDNGWEATGLKVVDSLSRKLTKNPTGSLKVWALWAATPRWHTGTSLSRKGDPCTVQPQRCWRKAPSKAPWDFHLAGFCNPGVAVQICESSLPDSDTNCWLTSFEGTQRSFLYQIWGYVG